MSIEALSFIMALRIDAFTKCEPHLLYVLDRFHEMIFAHLLVFLLSARGEMSLGQS